VCAVPLGPGHALLATAGHDRTVRLWDPLTGELEKILTGHTDLVSSVCAVSVGARGTLLATAGHDRTVRLWDPMTGRLEETLLGHTDWIRSVCAIPLGSGSDLLATAGDDRTVRLWHPATGRLVETIPIHHQATALAATQAGSFAVALSVGVLEIELTALLTGVPGLDRDPPPQSP
jgi:WD40 repeat protein